MPIARMVHQRSIRFLRESLAFSVLNRLPIGCNVAYFQSARLTRYLLSLAFSVLNRVQIGCNVARGRVVASRQYHLLYVPSKMVLGWAASQDDWQHGCRLCATSIPARFTKSPISFVLCVLKGVVLDRGDAIGFRTWLPPRFTKYLRPTAASADLFSFASILKRPSSSPRKVIPE